MSTRPITCPTCTHGFAVPADARTAICPRCGKALPILAATFSFTDEEMLPRRKADTTSPSTEPNKLARIPLRKISASRDFGDPTLADSKPAATPPPIPTAPAGKGRPPPLPPLPKLPRAGADAPPPQTGQQANYDVAILPKERRLKSDAFRVQTGVDLPHRPTGAPIDLSFYNVQPEETDAEDPTVGPDDYPTIPAAGVYAPPEPVIPVESSPNWRAKAANEEVVDDWETPESDGEESSAWAPVEESPGGGADDDWQEPPAEEWSTADGESWESEAGRPPAPEHLDDVPTAPEGLASATLGPALPAAEPDPEPDPEEAPPLPASRPPPIPSRPPRRRSPSQRVAALANAIEDEVSDTAIPVPPLRPEDDLESVTFGKTLSPTTAPGLGPPEDDAAPLNLPDTGIMVFVPEQPIEEVPIGAQPGQVQEAARYKNAPKSSAELAPVSARRPVVAKGHGSALRAGAASSSRSPLWYLVGGALALVALLIGAIVLYNHFHHV